MKDFQMDTYIFHKAKDAEDREECGLPESQED